MKVCRKSPWLVLLLGLLCLSATLQDVHAEAQSEGPSESECRPYIEKALKELETSEGIDHNSGIDIAREEIEDTPTVEITTDSSEVEDDDVDSDQNNDEYFSEKDEAGDIALSTESTESDRSDEENADNDADDPTKLTENDQRGVDDESEENVIEENTESSENVDAKEESREDESAEIVETSNENESAEAMGTEGDDDDDSDHDEQEEVAAKSVEDVKESEEGGEAEDEMDERGENSTKEDEAASDEKGNDVTNTSDDEGSRESEVDSKESTEDVEIEEKGTPDENAEEISLEDDVEKNEIESAKDVVEVEEDVKNLQTIQNDNDEDDSNEGADVIEDMSLEESETSKETSYLETDAEPKDDTSLEEGNAESDEDNAQSEEANAESGEANAESEEAKETNEPEIKHEVVDEDGTHSEEEEHVKESNEILSADDVSEVGSTDSQEVSAESGESAPEEDLITDDEIPADLRGTDHIGQLLKLNDENEETEKITQAVADITLRDLKKLYEHAIKPLEVLYKYRDLSNRHFGDSEIFSKPLVLFMGPWSGGKSSIINYLVDNEYKDTSLKTGAEPSPAYFNILMYGDEAEVLDGTQLAADYTFSGLQKFGQGLEERLRGMKLPKKLLEKINIVEIPGILEVRKQVSRVFPFNDACQWFIDRADIIFLVYDPSKLDVGPETEAILDQLKGREHQTRIILNKADQVKPEELMRVQGALIWNISPLMSSAQPPIMYTASLWSIPYEHWAPVRLLQAQERAFLRDLRSAVDKRIDNKISSARRFAVRVRNHAKMVDCYLTTYYNHKSVFGNRKQVADAIIERPQDYHIYEGLSTLTNISRYDLPDPDVYRDFFRLNPLYDFQQLSATCTYFRGCPINRLDVAIAYDLPELVGRHKRRLEAALAEADPAQTPVS